MRRLEKGYKVAAFAAVMTVAMLLVGCGKGGDEQVKVDALQEGWEPIPEAVVTPEPTEAPKEEEENVEGCYRSELTNEWIPEELKNQRPIAVMVDNEKKALPHFGVNSCDVVYEIMNSTLNGRITRLMCIAKDWENIEQLGSVRSTRPTNFMLAGEWDALLLHDGGPFYNDDYYKKDYVNHISGGFARIKNGKATEYTEYITPNEYNSSDGKTYDGLIKRIETEKVSREYTKFYPGPHFAFSNKEFNLSTDFKSITKSAKQVELPFPHNQSMLKYNEETKTYDYYVYGEKHIDELDGGKITSFKNVIIQSCSFCQLDENGYLIYNVIGSGEDGYYLTNGEAIPIAWIKTDEAEPTQFKNISTGEDIVLNTGKTYITIVPDDSWKDLKIK